MLGPVAAIAVSWLRVEAEPRVGEGLLVAALAVVPALFSDRRARAGAAAAAAAIVTVVAYDVSPAALVPFRGEEWLGPLRTISERGFYDYFEVALPFSPAERPEMHALTLVAIFGFGLAASLFAAAGRIGLAALALVVGAGWAATSVPERADLALGALVLASVLWLFALDRVRSPRALLSGGLLAAGLVGLSVAATGASAVAREAALDWRSWDLVDPPGRTIGVRYVWDADYTGIDWPETPTTVLRIRAPRRALYWRASTLDTFAADRWIENLYPVLISAPAGALPVDDLLPPAAASPSRWVEQQVEVAALRDDHVVAASTPTALESPSFGRLFFLSGGVVRAPEPLARGQRYVAWSYVPQPAPAELVRSRPDYPLEVGRYLDLGRTRLPPFGEPGRGATVDGLLGDSLHPDLAPYAFVWEAARRLTENAGSPYEAVLAVERWLRSDGGFSYDERPPRPPATVPPLVDFVGRARRGYCQHFAGAMALMLRFAGIPARVAVGFTSGRWDDGEWVVTDHDAHAWVEAWFEGHGWLTFDPTPGRGTITASYTFASDSADAIAALGAGRLLGLTGAGDSGAGDGGGALAAAPAAEGPSRPWAWLVALAAVVATASALGLVKLGRRRLRYRTADPRRVATATRAELVDFLRDQRVPVRPGAPPAEVGSALERRLGISARAWTRATERARYGAPEGAAAAAADARRELVLLLRAAREALRPGQRLRGFLSVRSLRGA